MVKNALGGGAFVALRMKKFIESCHIKCLHKKILSREKNDNMKKAA